MLIHKHLGKHLREVKLFQVSVKKYLSVTQGHTYIEKTIWEKIVSSLFVVKCKQLLDINKWLYDEI